MYLKIKEKKKCPECGNEIVYSEGCIICHNCGFSACGQKEKIVFVFQLYKANDDIKHIKQAVSF